MNYIKIITIYIIILILILINQKKLINQFKLDNIFRITRSGDIVYSSNLSYDYVNFIIYKIELFDLVNKAKKNVLYNPDIIDLDVLTAGVFISLITEIPEYAHIRIHKWVKENMDINLNQSQLNAVDLVADYVFEENVGILSMIKAWISDFNKVVENQETIQFIKTINKWHIDRIKTLFDIAINNSNEYLRYLAFSNLKIMIPEKYWNNYDLGEITLEELFKIYIENIQD